MPFLPPLRAFSNLAILHQIHMNLTKDYKTLKEANYGASR